ncbi:MAG: GLPGLI family protein [Bacteroidia bacterium]|nr:GLPGLI family protein [Bacteroidia bacterium]MBT8277558.1 GLPGLI family protein [Bacteroidia bacterium]NND25786.1 GLPGLI family protein [Flavobacteriaceae bacterium]NNK59916.1 GLPGLI family protein [Flavobacteriaceae bacterium]NNL32784.1 GLPGLI family protein [Flavobacteriaceae bacterium]
MKAVFLKLGFLLVIFFMSSSFNNRSEEFQGKAYYFSKSSMELGNWGARLSESQKKQIAERLKNRLEKTYVLTFNKEESMFKEEDKLDAISGATDSWGKNFAPGDQYKNVKSNTQIQTQEFYGKYFLVKDKLQPIEWQLGTETKQIGNYMVFKATASIPTNELTWYEFSWNNLSNDDEDTTTEVQMTEVEAWYTPQIPVSHGPLEYWGLPGLILEVSAGNTTMLCSKIVMNPEEKTEIEAPDRGKEITKKEYQETISNKMKEFRDNRMRRRG